MVKKSKIVLTPKQEKFCFNVAVKNMTYSDAYRNSYNAENYANDSINVNASKLMANANLLLRIDELRVEAREMMMKAELYDRKKHMEELEEIRQLALENEDRKELTTALKSVELKGKVNELYNFTQKTEEIGEGKTFSINVQPLKAKD